MPFDIATSVPIAEKEGKTFQKSKFDVNTSMPYSPEKETTFESDSTEGASLRSYTPTWRDKLNVGLEAIGLRPGRIERIGKAQAQVDEANQMMKAKGISFDESLLTIMSRERSDPVGAMKTFGSVLRRTPKSIGIAVLKMHQGAEGASVNDKGWATRMLKEAGEDTAKFSQSIQSKFKEKRIFPGVPIKVTDVGQLPESMAYSVVSMGAGAALGIPIAFAPIPGARVAAWATGTVASGKAAFEMSTYEIMQEYLEFKNEEMISNEGRGLFAAEEFNLKKDFDSKAREFGLWEAIPEALSNLAFAKILTAPLTKMVGSSVAGRITGKMIGLYGEELLTETITEKGQTKIRRKEGLEEVKEGEEAEIPWSEAFKRVAPQTFLLTTIMAGTGATLIKTKQAIQKSLKREIGEGHPEFDDISKGMDEMVVTPGEGFNGEGKISSVSEQIAPEPPITPAKSEIAPIAEEPAPTPEIKPEVAKTPAVEPIAKEIEPEAPSKEIVAEKTLRQEKLSTEEAEAYPDLAKTSERFNELKAKEAALKKGVKNAMTPLEIKELTRITEELGGIVQEKIKKAPTAKKILGIEEAKVTIKESILLRERIKNIQRGFREGKVFTKKEVEDSQTSIIKLLDKSELEAKDKATFIKTIKNIQTDKQLRKSLPLIIERINILEEKAEVRFIKTKIKKEIKGVKTKKQAGKIVGKFTPETQGALDTIKKAIKLDKDAALDIIQKNIDKTTGLLPSEDIALQNEVLSLFSDFDNKSAGDLVSLLDMVTKLKAEGKEARVLLRTERKEHLDELRKTVVEQVTGGRGIKPGVETTGAKKTMPQAFSAFLKGIGTRWIGQWNTYMDTIEFNAGVENKKLADLFSVLNQENYYKELEHKFREKFDKAILDAYGIKSDKEGVKGKIADTINVHKKIHELSKEINLGKVKNADGVEVELSFTKDELIKKWMELQDPTLTESFEKGNKYTSEIISVIESKMSNEDKAFAKKQFALYKEQWSKLNPLYRKFFGVNLSFNEFYSPIAREGYHVDTSKGLSQLIEDTSFRVGVSTKSLKARVKNILPIKTRGSVYTLDNHFKETNYFMAWAEKIKDIEATFKDTEVRAAINQEFSPGVYKAIVTKIEHLANKGNINSQRYPGIDFFRKGFTVGRLMLKPALTVKQFVSTVAYYEKVGIGDFVAGAIDFWKNPVENYKTLQKESVFIKTRGSGMERDMKAATQAGLADKFFTTKAFANLLLVNNRIGDKGAIVWGSWILRRARLKQEVDINNVIKEYEEFSANTQQSADISRLSEVQLGGSIERLFTMFKTSQRQYLAKELTAIKTLFQEGGTSSKNIKKVAKTMLIYHVLLPMMFQFIANGGGWEEDDQKEYIRAGLLGSLNGLFIFGDAIDSILRKALGLRVFNLEVPILSVTNSVKKAVGKIDWDDIDSKDVLEATAKLSEAGDSFYLPISTIKNFGAGVADVIDGNVRVGILEMLGWSRNVVGEKGRKKVYK